MTPRPATIEAAALFLALSLPALFALPQSATAQTPDTNAAGLSAQVRYGFAISGETPAVAGTFQRSYPIEGNTPQPHDPWLAFDKVQHFTFSALFTVGGQYALENKADWRTRHALPISVLTSFTIGLTKELYDWQVGPGQYFSWRDMVANGVGIAFATGFILL